MFKTLRDNYKSEQNPLKILVMEHIFGKVRGVLKFWNYNILSFCVWLLSKAYLEPTQTSKMELFAESC